MSKHRPLLHQLKSTMHQSEDPYRNVSDEELLASIAAKFKALGFAARLLELGEKWREPSEFLASGEDDEESELVLSNIARHAESCGLLIVPLSPPPVTPSE